MDYPLPPDFIPLSQADETKHTNLNVIGVVVDFQPAAPTKGQRKQSSQVNFRSSFISYVLFQIGRPQSTFKTHHG
jgi:hypothetical protein